MEALVGVFYEENDDMKAFECYEVSVAKKDMYVPTSNAWHIDSKHSYNIVSLPFGGVLMMNFDGLKLYKHKESAPHAEVALSQ